MKNLTELQVLKIHTAVVKVIAPNRVYPQDTKKAEEITRAVLAILEDEGIAWYDTKTREPHVDITGW